MKKLLLPLVLSFMALTSQAQTYHLDVNNNGSIDLTDALTVIDYILGRFNPEDNQQPQSYLTCPDDHHPHLIDLGLPSGTKWACCNVGATTPEGYGGYYAWGETEEKEAYNEVTYLYCTGEDTNGDGWYDDWHEETSTKGIWSDLGGVIAGTEYDVAHVKWDGCWQMPSFDQINELLENCTFEWSTVNGIYGARFIGKNGASVFLPASGTRSNEDIFDIGNNCFYWASTLGTTGLPYADGMSFASYGAASVYSFRGNGQSVRPVAGKAETKSYHMDVNNDGSIELTDALIIIDYILGKFNPDGEWYMVARTSEGETQMIPAKEVGSLVAVDDALDFTILGTNGNIIMENVQRVDFKSEKEINSSEELSAIKSKGMPSKVKGITKTAQEQCTFVVADKNGNNNLVQELTFQHDSKGSSWNGDGLSGDVRNLQYIARTRIELATASSEDVTKMLEEFSGTGQTDAQAVAATLKNNPNVEESYTEDGDNLIVKYKDSEGDVVYPLYEMMSPFSDLQVPDLPDYSSLRKSPQKAPHQYPNVAIFNFFEGMSQYKVQNIITKSIKTFFEENGYQVNYYTTNNTNSSLKFTYAHLNDVLSHSADYAAVIIMTHGAQVNGESCLCTGELAGKDDESLHNWADGKYYKRYSAELQAESNCILYLGICDGLSKDNFKSSSPTIGYSGPTRMAQANAAILFYLMLKEGYTLKKALGSLRPEPAPNESTMIYKSSNVGNKEQTLESNGIFPDYMKGYYVEPYYVQKSGDYTKVKGYFPEFAGDKFIKIEFLPILWYNPKEQDDYYNPQLHFTTFTDKNGYFESSFYLKNVPENIYICRIYGYVKEYGWQLVRPDQYKFFVRSENYKENSAEVEATEESVTRPYVLGTDGKSVEEITIPAGTSQMYQIDAYPGHTLGTPCLDTDVVTVSLSGTTLTVTGVSEGSTVFGVYDRQNRQMAVVKVTVTKGGDMPSYLICPDDHHPHLIDLGLPSGTKWACCNVGATTPEGFGGYYAWGETEEKATYDWSTYIHCDGSKDTSYNLGSDIAGTQYDVAHVKWSGSWVMPSYDQQVELLDNCSSEWTTVDGINGWVYTGSNGGSIFLPATGSIWNNGPHYAGSFGYYWSSTQSPSNSDNAYGLYFASGGASFSKDGLPRGRGQSVRPVVGTNNVTPLQISTTSLSLIVGDQENAEITSGSGSYSIEKINPEGVVTASIVDNSSVAIEAKTTGTAVITIKDNKSGQTASIEVTVSGGSAPAYYLTCPDDHHPHLIDLGLPSGTKWACCNVGAETPEGYGGYYAWGETEEKDYYDWSTYTHCDGSYGTWHDLGTDIAGTQYDVAHVKWGGSWVMPSHDQQTELWGNCSSVWMTVNGINGRIFTGSNGGSIFLPAAGNRLNDVLDNSDSRGIYWSSTDGPSNPGYAFDFYFHSGDVDYGGDNRSYGQSVRPVSSN